MNKSYEKVNYLLRLKKQIERKLIIETLQTLDSVISISSYHYFGFGSVYFADYILFHKYLNVAVMTSIDNKRDDELRFKFNIPFGFIDFALADCFTYLSKDLNWEDKLFMWLDYDLELDKSMLRDVELVASKAKALDIFLVTVEAESPSNPHTFMEVYKDLLPSDMKVKSIKMDFPSTLYHVLLAAVRNGLIQRTDTYEFIPLFNFEYKDTKEMYTFGGIFCRIEVVPKLKKKIAKLHYITRDSQIVHIDCPLLTPKEKMHLDACVKMRCKIDCRFREVKATGLKADAIKRYCLYYKYYPQFFESIY